jgi:bile acid:Na+ symporter, BASS family
MGDIDSIRLAFDPTSLRVLGVIMGFVMLGVALDLRVDDFRAAFREPKGPLVGLLAQFVVLPAATFGLTLLLNPPPSVALGMILVAACPGGNISNFLTHLARGRTALSICMTAVSTAAAIVMTPLNVAVWGSLRPGTAALLANLSLSPMDLFFAVAVLLGVPLILGMLIAAKLPKVAGALRKPFRWLSIAFFFAFVAMAIHANGEHFSVALPLVFIPVLIHNATALGTGYGLARLARLPATDARAVSLEVGIQNSGLGLFLIFAYFDGLGGMAVIAAWWGVWHIIAGLSVATFWSRRHVAPQPAVELQP